jgi:PAS domain S-box-containing protein
MNPFDSPNSAAQQPASMDDAELRQLRLHKALANAMLDAALDSIISIDQDSRVLEWNAAAERTFGYARADAIGRDLTELIIPPELREQHRLGMARFLRTGEGPVIGRRVEVDGQTRDGRRLPVELAISPITIGGRTHFTAYLRDISARRTAEAALREGEQRLRATYENAFAGIGEVDRAGRFTRVNGQLSAITGYEPQELVGRTIWDITHSVDASAERELFERQMRGEAPRYSLEKRYVHKAGHEVWVELAASTVDDADGRPLYGVRVVQDISDRKRWEARQRLLIHELNHRVKNTLATVQSIAAQTRRTVADPNAAYDAFVERLVALSSAHDVLTAEQWRGADLARIAAEALRPFGGPESGRFDVRGGPVWLPPQAAVAFAMALHELATNAVKYGALSVPDGRVTIAWDVDSRSGQPILELAWAERGGPPVTPPERQGFGSRLLQRGLAAELEGEVRLGYPPEGVVCTVRAPIRHGPLENLGA